MTRQVGGNSGGAREAGQLGEWRVTVPGGEVAAATHSTGEGREGENTLVRCISAETHSFTHSHSLTHTHTHNTEAGPLLCIRLTCCQEPDR